MVKCEWLTNFDLFGKPIHLNFREQQLYQTQFGGIISLLMIAFIISVFSSNIFSYFTKSQVTSNTLEHFNSEPELMNISFSDFMFAVQIQQTNFLTNPYFNITVEQRHYHRDANGSFLYQNTKYLDMIPCTLQHFDQIFNRYNVNFSTEYIQNTLPDFLCPNLNIESIIFGGKYTSEDYYFLKIGITDCQNSTSSNFTWKPKCQTQEAIQKVMNTTGNFRFQLYTTNYVINPQNPQKQIQPYLAIDQFYTFAPNVMFTTSNVFWSNTEIITDESVTPLMSESSVQNLPTREIGDFRQQFQTNRLTPGYYCSVYPQSSQYSYQITRSYLKLDQLLSYLGGFAQAIIIFLSFFMKYYNYYHCVVSIANDLYDFDFNKIRRQQSGWDKLLFQTESGREQLKNVKKSKQNQPIIMPSIQIQHKIGQFGSKLQLPFTPSSVNSKRYSALQINISQFFHQFLEMTKPRQAVHMSLRYIMSELTNLKIFMNRKTKLMQKATQQITRSLDLTHILQQLNEIDKIKQIMFSKEQTQLFNFTQKPKIYIDQKNGIAKFQQGTDQEESTDLEQFQNLVNSYRLITALDIDNMSEEQKRFNTRLIKLMGVKIANIIEQEIANYKDYINEEQIPEEKA